LKTPDSDEQTDNSGEDDLDEFVESYSGSEENSENQNEDSSSTKRIDFHGAKKTERNEE